MGRNWVNLRAPDRRHSSAIDAQHGAQLWGFWIPQSQKTMLNNHILSRFHRTKFSVQATVYDITLEVMLTQFESV